MSLFHDLLNDPDESFLDGDHVADAKYWNRQEKLTKAKKFERELDESSNLD